MRPDQVSASAGSALLLVLWSLLLLSMSVFGVVEIVQTSITHASHLEAQAQARALAMSGLAVALHPEMKRKDSLLQQQPAQGGKWDVTLRGEAGRLNLNFVLGHHREILTRLFTAWGMKEGEAEGVTDCLYDWITPGNTPSPHGAKEAEYRRAGLTHFPSGKPFTSLAEARQVMGMTEVEKLKPDWQDSFTLWSDGPLDVNEATPDLLAAVFALPLSQTEAFVATRNGKDGLPETDDDVTVKGTAELKLAFGLSDKNLTSIADEISFIDPIRRVESVGEADGVAVTVSAVVRLQTSPPDYLLWTEL
jgi:type II secretory pathway component PulK